MFRHSIFFDDHSVADVEELWIALKIVPADMYQSTDSDTGIIELRFFTEYKLDHIDQRIIARGNECSYVFNCQD